MAGVDAREGPISVVDGPQSSSTANATCENSGKNLSSKGATKSDAAPGSLPGRHGSSKDQATASIPGSESKPGAKTSTIPTSQSIQTSQGSAAADKPQTNASSSEVIEPGFTRLAPAPVPVNSPWRRLHNTRPTQIVDVAALSQQRQDAKAEHRRDPPKKTTGKEQWVAFTPPVPPSPPVSPSPGQPKGKRVQRSRNKKTPVSHGYNASNGNGGYGGGLQGTHGHGGHAAGGAGQGDRLSQNRSGHSSMLSTGINGQYMGGMHGPINEIHSTHSSGPRHDHNTSGNNNNTHKKKHRSVRSAAEAQAEIPSLPPLPLPVGMMPNMPNLPGVMLPVAGVPGQQIPLPLAGVPNMPPVGNQIPMGPVPYNVKIGLVARQVEYYLSTQNLCRDIHLRRYMNAKGLVPIKVLAGFNVLKAISGGDIHLVEQACRLLHTVEVIGQRVRPRQGWEQWILPAGDRFEEGNQNDDDDDAPKFQVEHATPFVPKQT